MILTMNKYHVPVLLKESVAGLNVKSNGIYVDATFGGGGHSREILKGLGSEGRLYAFDQDEAVQQNLIDDNRFKLIMANFQYLKRFLRIEGVHKIDGILADFGVSSHQFDVAERGFSTRYDARLDMRMNQHQELDAYAVINTYSEEDLRALFYRYGELRNAPNIARTIVEARKTKKIKTTKELNELLIPILFKNKQNKILAQIYQAIRIEVNSELEVLKSFLKQTEEVLKPGGRLSVIAYHSLEDRMVKRYIRSGSFDQDEPEKDFYGNPMVPFKRISKLIKASPEEISQNSRARSARLRIAERLEYEQD